MSFLRESDDVNKIIQQLLEDKKLPLEWHERVAFALSSAKDILERKLFFFYDYFSCVFFFKSHACLIQSLSLHSKSEIIYHLAILLVKVHHRI